MLAVEEAVVGGVDQQRVLELARVAQRADDPLDALVDRQQRLGAAAIAPGGVGDLLGRQRRAGSESSRLVADVGLVEVRRLGERLVRERADVSRRRLRGAVAAALVRRVGVGPAAVGCEIGEREEERPAVGRPAGDQLDRLVRVGVGRVRLRRGRGVGILGIGAVGDPLAVLEQLVAVEEVGPLRAVPFRPTRGNADGASLVAVEELADVRRVVPGALQPHRQRLRRVEAVEAPERRRVAEHAVVVGVLAREQRGARRAAERPVRHAHREGRPAAADQLGDPAHVAHRVLRLVVAHDHDDVRPPLRGRGSRGGCGGDCGRRADERHRQRRSPDPANRTHRPS